MISDERICTIAEDWTGVGAVSIYDDVAEAIKQALQESTPLIRKQVIGEIADWLDERTDGYKKIGFHVKGLACKESAIKLRVMSEHSDHLTERQADKEAIKRKDALLRECLQFCGFPHPELEQRIKEELK